MSAILDVFKNLDDNSKKLLKKGLIVFVGVIVIIIVISIIVSIINRKISYEQMEEIMANAAYKYYQTNLNQLPTAEVKTTVVSAQTLVDQEYMKPIEKYTKDESCTGNVVVTYVNGNYDYQSYLTCNSFITSLLVDKIKKDNPVVTSGAGLYDESGVLRFRGEYVNNYLKVDDQIYRIIKLDSEGKIYIIRDNIDPNSEVYNSKWDDRYNIQEDSNCGINDYSLSRIKRSLTDIEEKLPKLLRNNTTAFNLCIGKRNQIDTRNNGEVECSNVLENQNIGLLPVYEYIRASIDPTCNSISTKTCKNYNYLYLKDKSWWTLTGNSENTRHVYYISGNGVIDKDSPDYRKNNRYVVALKANTVLKDGNGTEAKPYTIR